MLAWDQMTAAKNATQNEYLTPEQAAEKLQVSRATVLDWLRAGKLRGAKLGYRTWRITGAEIDALMERQQPEPQ